METPLTAPILGDPAWAAYTNKSALRRWASADEMAGTVWYLASDVPSFVKLASSGVRALTSGSWRRRWRWPGNSRQAQSGHGANAGAGVRYQVARFGSPPSGLPHARLGGRSAVALRCRAGRGVIADWGAMDT